MLGDKGCPSSVLNSAEGSPCSSAFGRRPPPRCHHLRAASLPWLSAPPFLWTAIAAWASRELYSGGRRTRGGPRGKGVAWDASRGQAQTWGTRCAAAAWARPWAPPPAALRRCHPAALESSQSHSNSEGTSKHSCRPQCSLLSSSTSCVTLSTVAPPPAMAAITASALSRLQQRHRGEPRREQETGLGGRRGHEGRRCWGAWCKHVQGSQGRGRPPSSHASHTAQHKFSE